MSTRTGPVRGLSPRAPAALVVTRDADLLRRIRALGSPAWRIIARGSGRAGRDVLRDGDVELIVVDDEALDENEQGWLLDQIRKRSPQAAIVYIAARHSVERERSMRARGILWYTSRPLDLDRFDRVLRLSFAQPLLTA